jgi:hypothetical protein
LPIVSLLKGFLRKERGIHAHKNVNITNMAEEYETVEYDCHPLIIYLLTVTEKWAETAITAAVSKAPVHERLLDLTNETYNPPMGCIFCSSAWYSIA